MLIKVLDASYFKSGEAFKDFNLGKSPDLSYYTEGSMIIDDLPYFKPYFGSKVKGSSDEDFINSFMIMEEDYNEIDREYTMNPEFWYSLFVLHFREELIRDYPGIETDESYFNLAINKSFDWENYIYKMVLGAQYISENIVGRDRRNFYYNLIVNNLDVYNYLLKKTIFRNDRFLIEILKIIDKHEISGLLKKKIKGREDLSDDERYGRRVIHEFNKSYPVVLSPMLGSDEIEKLFFRYLEMYYKPTE